MDLPKLAFTLPPPPDALSQSPPVRMLKRSNPYFRIDEFRKAGSADGGRQDWFRSQLIAISNATSSLKIPFAFEDATGARYVLDRGAVKFGVNSGFIERLEDHPLGGVREITLKQGSASHQ